MSTETNFLLGLWLLRSHSEGNFSINRLFTGKPNLAGIRMPQMLQTKNHHKWCFCQTEYKFRLIWSLLCSTSSISVSESVIQEWQRPTLAYKQQPGVDGFCCTRLDCQYARWSSSRNQSEAVRTLIPAHRGEDKQQPNSTPTCQSLDLQFLSLWTPIWAFRTKRTPICFCSAKNWLRRIQNWQVSERQKSLDVVTNCWHNFMLPASKPRLHSWEGVW